MLSAVAARKARLQAKGQSSAPSTPTPQRSTSPEPVQVTAQRAKPSSKRKPPGETAKPLSNKRRKVGRAQEKGKPASRYFQQDEHVKDAFREQEDVIVVADSDGDEDENQSSSASEGEEPSEHVVRGTRQRAWSPSAPFQDSSEDEDVEEGAETPLDFEEPELVPPPRPVADARVPLSTYRPASGQNIFDIGEPDLQALGFPAPSPAKLLCLVGSDRVALVGTCSLFVLYGSVTLLGTTLTPSTTVHRVFAPRSSPLPVIECLPLINRSPSTANIPQPFQKLVKSADAIVVLQDLKTGIEGLGRVCRTFEGVFDFSRWQKNQSDVDLGLSSVHYVAYEAPECKSFVLPPSWSSAISSVLPATDAQDVDFSRQVHLIKGAKKSGKSTFARTLLNNLSTHYRKVAFLECDLGQSEFTPGGMVALNLVSSPVFGPPFTHPSIPYQAHYIGSTSPRNCPSSYLEAVSALVQTYNVDVQHALLEDTDCDATDPLIADIIPLVVNMMGWTKGLGADLSKKIEDMVEPSTVYEFEAPSFEDGWPTYHMHVSGQLPSRTTEVAVDATGRRIFNLEPISPAVMSTRYSPADHRTLSVLSYFHAVFPSDALASHSGLRSEYATSWNTTLPLCAQPPYELSAQDALDDVVLIGPGAEDVVPAEVERVLNGAVVALVTCEPGAIDRTTDDTNGSKTSGIPYAQGAPPPSPSMSISHGLALIRSVISDASSLRLHVLTPLPPSVLAAVKPRMLVKGEMELPVWGMLDFRSEDTVAGVERGKVPYLRWGKGAGVGGERRRVRRNLMRRGQM